MILGVNIGKNKDTPLERAGEDYLTLLRTFAPLADYLAVNVSSPNTPGLRTLQSQAALEGLLRPGRGAGRTGAGGASASRPGADARSARPLLVKLAPDLTESELDDALAAILATGMDGVILSNTTLRVRGCARHVGRDGRAERRSAAGAQHGDGASRGAHCRRQAAHHCQRRRHVSGRLPAELDAGATLVQLYTGLIYAGPSLVKRVLVKPDA